MMAHAHTILRVIRRTLVYLILISFMMGLLVNIQRLDKHQGWKLRKSRQQQQQEEVTTNIETSYDFRDFAKQDENTSNDGYVSDLAKKVQKLNERQYVLNEHKFGPVDTDTTIIVIQVNKYILLM